MDWSDLHGGMPGSVETLRSARDMMRLLALRHGSFCVLGGPCQSDVGDATIYVQVNVWKIIGSPTSKEAGHPQSKPAGLRLTVH